MRNVSVSTNSVAAASIISGSAQTPHLEDSSLNLTSPAATAIKYVGIGTSWVYINILWSLSELDKTNIPENRTFKGCLIFNFAVTIAFIKGVS